MIIELPGSCWGSFQWSGNGVVMPLSTKEHLSILGDIWLHAIPIAPDPGICYLVRLATCTFNTRCSWEFILWLIDQQWIPVVSTNHKKIPRITIKHAIFIGSTCNTVMVHSMGCQSHKLCRQISNAKGGCCPTCQYQKTWVATQFLTYCGTLLVFNYVCFLGK